MVNCSSTLISIFSNLSTATTAACILLSTTWCFYHLFCWSVYPAGLPATGSGGIRGSLACWKGQVVFSAAKTTRMTQKPTCKLPAKPLPCMLPLGRGPAASPGPTGSPLTVWVCWAAVLGVSTTTFVCSTREISIWNMGNLGKIYIYAVSENATWKVLQWISSFYLHFSIMFSMSNMTGREVKQARCYFAVETVSYNFTGIEPVLFLFVIQTYRTY